jgi:hypothetical protein
MNIYPAAMRVKRDVLNIGIEFHGFERSAAIERSLSDE